MNSSLVSTCITCAWCCYLFVPFVFQFVGVFTPMWASNATCDSIGLVYSCCLVPNKDECGISNGLDELDIRALGLHVTSYIIIVSNFLCMCCIACCYDNYEECCCGMACIFLYPVAGLFSFIGCMIVVTQYSTSDLGYSFGLCLTASCLINSLTICFLCEFFIFENHTIDDRPTIRSSSVRPSSELSVSSGGGIAPYDPSEVHVHREVQENTAEQTVAVQNTGTGRVIVNVKRNKFGRLLPTSKNK